MRGRKDTNTLDYFGTLMKNVPDKTNEIIIIEEKKEEGLAFSKEFLEKYINYNQIDNITEEEEVRKYLKEEYTKYIQLGSGQALLLGKYYTELFEGLSTREKGNNQFTSTYTKYLKEILKISPRTAKRYRNKYELYIQASNPRLKNLIAILSHEDTEILYANKAELIPELDKCTSYEEIENLLMSDRINNSTQKVITDTTFLDLDKISTNLLDTTEKTLKFLEKKDRTPDEEKKAIKILELVNKIEKLLNE